MTAAVLDDRRSVLSPRFGLLRHRYLLLPTTPPAAIRHPLAFPLQCQGCALPGYISPRTAAENQTTIRGMTSLHRPHFPGSLSKLSMTPPGPTTWPRTKDGPVPQTGYTRGRAWSRVQPDNGRRSPSASADSVFHQPNRRMSSRPHWSLDQFRRHPAGDCIGRNVSFDGPSPDLPSSLSVTSPILIPSRARVGRNRGKSDLADFPPFLFNFFPLSLGTGRDPATSPTHQSHVTRPWWVSLSFNIPWGEGGFLALPMLSIHNQTAAILY